MGFREKGRSQGEAGCPAGRLKPWAVSEQERGGWKLEGAWTVAMLIWMVRREEADGQERENLCSGS